MADTYPEPYEISTADAEGLSGTTHTDSALPFIAAGTTPQSSPSLKVQYLRLDRLVKILLGKIGRVIRDKAGQRHVGCYPFDVPYASGAVNRFTGAKGYELTGGDNTYKVYIDRSVTPPVLAHGTSWPASKDDYLPLAEYTVSSGAITTTDDAADKRSIALFGGFLAATAGTGTTSTTFTIDSDNAGAGVDTSLLFNRGTDGGGEDAELGWDETNDRFLLHARNSTNVLAQLNLLALLVSGTTVIDTNGELAVGAIGSTKLYAFGANGGTPYGVQLTAMGSAGAPASGTHALGELALDSNGQLWVCTAAGAPGTWTETTLLGGTVTAAMLETGLRSKILSVSVGDASGAGSATAVIQIQDMAGNNVSGVVYLEVGIYDDADAQSVAANATISDGGSGAFLDDVGTPANKVFRAKTDSSGALQVLVADGTPEVTYLCVRATRRSRLLDGQDYGTITIT